MKKYLVWINLIGLALLCIIIWFGGSLFTDSSNKPLLTPAIRIWLIIASIILWCLIYLVKYLVTKHTNKKLVNLLTTQDTNDNKKISTNELEQLKQYAKEIFILLKKTRISSGKKVRPLIDLPWYFILGLANSGKSSAIDNSGLDFPFAKYFSSEQFKKFKQLQNCKWWISDQAVFLEISRFNEQWDANTTQAAWQSLLKLLKKYKGNKATNGVLITINVLTLLKSSEQEIIFHHNKAIQHLKDLHQQLDTTFPVYLLITQCDQIAGFTPFFKELSATERNQAYGISFPVDHISQENTANLFNERFEDLIQNLKQHIADYLIKADHTSPDLVYFFPQQMELLKQPLYEAIKDIFIVSKLCNVVHLRGVYFCSAKQEGTSHDFMMSIFNKEYGLEPPPAIPTEGKQQPYFLKQLFQNVILADEHLSDYSGYNRKRYRLRKALSYSTAAGIIGFGTLLLTMAFQHEKMNAQLVAKSIQSYQQQNKLLTKDKDNYIDILPILNSLKQAADVYNLDSDSWKLHFQLYHHYRIQTATNQALSRTANRLLLPIAFNRIEQLLNLYQDKPGLLSFAFQAYLGFSNLSDKKNQQHILEALKYDWAHNYQYPHSVQNQLADYLKLALNYPTQNFQFNSQLAAITKQRLERFEPAEIAYNRLTIEAEQRQSHPLNISQEINTFNQLFANTNESQLTIPFLYTMNGYKEFYLKNRQSIANQVANQLWETDIANNIAASPLALTQQILAGMNQLYANDYYQYWSTLVNNLSVIKFHSLTQASNCLQTLLQKDSALNELLTILNENTNVTLKNDKIDLQKSFAIFNQFAHSDKQQSVSLQTTIEAISHLNNYLNKILQAPDQNEAQFAVIQSTIKNNETQSAIAGLQEQGRLAPAPIAHWLSNIDQNIQSLLVTGAAQYINQQWEAKVMQSYSQSIASLYPFNHNSMDDASLLAVINFFGDRGILEQFFNTYLQPFVNTNTSPWQFKQIDSYNFGAAQKTLKSYQYFSSLKKLLFSPQTDQPAIQFTIEPLQLDNKAAAIQLQIGKQMILYRHGPPQAQSIQWPLPADAQTVLVTIRNFDQQKFNLSFDGPWALFRLLQTGKLHSTVNPNQYIFEINLEGYIASFNITINNQGDLKKLI